jgi:hypothetical protein
MSSMSILSPLPDPTAKLRELTEENARLADRVDELEAELRKERRKNETKEKGAEELMKFLTPLYQGLQMMFGHMEAMGVSASQTSTASGETDPRTKAVWDNWKQKLGEGPAKIIDALLLHREMNTQQLAIATQYHRTTIPALIFKLNKAGLLNKNGGRFSLKEL